MQKFGLFLFKTRQLNNFESFYSLDFIARKFITVKFHIYGVNIEKKKNRKL